jgi:hypothetical protein
LKTPLILLTCRPAASDFRYHLAVALAELGHPVTYIFLKRRPVVTDMTTKRSEQWSLGRLVRYFAGLRSLKRRDRPVVFNSTNLAFPLLSVLLRRVSGTAWCFDMHDDLLYNATGLARAKASVAQHVMLSQSDAIVHAAPTLKRLFPRSRHIGNGSALEPLPKVGTDGARVLILASLDGRFDFAFMADAARLNPDRRFEIWGRVSQNDRAIQRDLDALIAAHGNISYHGAYSDPDLPALLARYAVAFAPYKTASRLTEFIDPLRFYHCLASGTGLVSTPIPQALAMADQIDIAADANEVDIALRNAIARKHGKTRTWRDVAETLVPILNDMTVRQNGRADAGRPAREHSVERG